MGVFRFAALDGFVPRRGAIDSLNQCAVNRSGFDDERSRLELGGPKSFSEFDVLASSFGEASQSIDPMGRFRSMFWKGDPSN